MGSGVQFVVDNVLRREERERFMRVYAFDVPRPDIYRDEVAQHWVHICQVARLVELQILLDLSCSNLFSLVENAANKEL